MSYNNIHENRSKNRAVNPFLSNTPDPSPQKPGLLKKPDATSTYKQNTSPTKQLISPTKQNSSPTKRPSTSYEGSPLKSFQNRAQQGYDNPLLLSPLKKSKSNSTNNSPYTDRLLPRRTEMDLNSVKYINSVHDTRLNFDAHRQRNGNVSSFPFSDNNQDIDTETQVEMQKLKQADQLYDLILKNELFGDKLDKAHGKLSGDGSQDSLEIIKLASNSSANSSTNNTTRSRGSDQSGYEDGGVRTTRGGHYDNNNINTTPLNTSLELSPTRSLNRMRRRTLMTNSVSMPSIRLSRSGIFDLNDNDGNDNGVFTRENNLQNDSNNNVRRRLNFAQFDDSDNDEEEHTDNSDDLEQRNNASNTNTTNTLGDLGILKTKEKPRDNIIKGVSLLQYSTSETGYKSRKSADDLSSIKKLIDRNNDVMHNKVTPVRLDSKKLLLSPSKKIREIPKIPFRVLDAPGLADDFYYDLIDWSSRDVLGVVLGKSCFLTDNKTSEVTELCSLGDETNTNYTSLQWVGSGTHLALGLSNGLVQIYDVIKKKCIRTLSGHIDRVSCLSWNNHILSSGSRDSKILHRDVRSPEQFFETISSHTQEVCGLKWNVVENKLASGGNDNVVCVYDGTNRTPTMKIEEHTAAVKALGWSPHKRGLLATGGGTVDRHLKVWNVNTSMKVKDVDTGSQVCNLVWSKNTNEILTSHGFSKFQLTLWDYPTMDPVATLKGHSFRVLHLTLSLDGTTVVSGAGDETLRYWKLFDNIKSSRQQQQQNTGMGHRIDNRNRILDPSKDDDADRSLTSSSSIDLNASYSHVDDSDSTNSNTDLIKSFKSIR